MDLYHGEGAGTAAEARFDQVHRDHELPDDVPEHQIPQDVVRDGAVYLPKLMSALGLADSNSQARRLIEQGGVKLDGEAVTDAEKELPVAQLRGRVLQVGRRGFARLG